MIVRIACAGLLLLIFSLSACGDDDDELGGLDRSAVLGQLDESESRALCDVGEQLSDESVADETGRRATCFRQLVADIEVALLNVDFSPDRFSADAVVADCEAALARCMDEGPMRRSCETLEFEASCRGTVGDYGRCIEDTLAAARVYATTDCEKYVQDEAERERIAEALREGLASCPKVLGCKSESEPEQDEAHWFDGGVGSIEADAGPADTRSNEQWLSEVEAVTLASDRPGCAGPLEHDAELDDPAAMIAAAPFGSQHDFDFTAEWKWVSAPDLDSVLERIQIFLDETASACKWRRYGLGIAGEPGKTREVVLLIAE